MKLAELVAELDAYFRIPDVRDDDWSEAFDRVYPAPYWREYVVSGWEGCWNGLAVRGAEDVERAVTCVFPSDRIVETLAPATFLFAEHPLDFADEHGFLPLSLETYEAMRENGISFYNAHAPLDMHPDVSPSRLCAEGVGLEVLEEYFPICQGSLERGCQTYVTGNAATTCRLDFVQEQVRAFRERADAAGVTLIDAMHYGMEKPPQLAMVEWFRARGLKAAFEPDGPK